MKLRALFLLFLTIAVLLAIVGFHKAFALRQAVLSLQERMKYCDLKEAENIALKAQLHHDEADQTELAFLRGEASDALRLRAKVTALNSLLEGKAESTSFDLQLSNRLQELTFLNEQLEAKLQLQTTVALTSNISASSQVISSAVVAESDASTIPFLSNVFARSHTTVPFQPGAFVPPDGVLPPNHQLSNLDCASCHNTAGQ